MLKTVSCELGKAEARLLKLEGAISLDKAKGEDDVAWMFDEEVGIGSRVHRLLRDHVAFWEQTWASQFAPSVIKNVYIPDMMESIKFYE